jgi:hypothetical protein
VPKLVSQYLSGELPIDHYITHTYKGVDKVRCTTHLPFRIHLPDLRIIACDLLGIVCIYACGSVVAQINDAIHALHGGECLRAVVSYF